MEITLWLILWIIFLYFNYRILLSDVQEKRIPNSYIKKLLYLSPFALMYWYIYQYYFFADLWGIVWGAIIVFLISFILYHFDLWGAGDAKYITILSLLSSIFFSFSGFFLNIVIITCLYLLYTFVKFWGYKVYDIKNLTAFYKGIKTDLYFNALSKFWEKSNIYKRIFHYLLLFALYIILIRILRMYLFSWALYFYDIFPYFSKDNYILLSVIAIFFLIISISIVWKNIIGKIIEKPFFHKYKHIFLYGTICILSMYICYEILVKAINKHDIIFLISMVICIKILLYSIKLMSFSENSQITSIDEVQEWMVIDKKFLSIPKSSYISLNRKLQKKDIALLKKNEVQQVRVLNFFAFSPFIFLGFILNIFYWTSIFSWLLWVVKIYIFK